MRMRSALWQTDAAGVNAFRLSLPEACRKMTTRGHHLLCRMGLTTASACAGKNETDLRSPRLRDGLGLKLVERETASDLGGKAAGPVRKLRSQEGAGVRQRPWRTVGASLEGLRC